MIGKRTWTGSQALSTTFATITLTNDKDKATGPVKLGGLWLYGTTLAGGAATLTVRISRDSGGDELVTPDYAVEIDIGKTTATDITSIIDFDAIPMLGVATLYVHIKTDAGTATLTEANLTYTY